MRDSRSMRETETEREKSFREREGRGSNEGVLCVIQALVYAKKVDVGRIRRRRRRRRNRRRRKVGSRVAKLCRGGGSH